MRGIKVVTMQLKLGGTHAGDFNTPRLFLKTYAPIVEVDVNTVEIFYG